MLYDAIVVGNGPCGISCAIYLKRYGYQVLVIGKDGGALEKAHWIENYYGIPKITGKELIEAGISQARALGIEVLTAEVLNIEKPENFTVETTAENYHAKTVMLACGTSRNKLELAARLEGNGVSYCATCDGFFYRKKRVAVVGSGEYMRHELAVLENMIPDLTIFTNGQSLDFTPSDHIKVVTDKIKSFEGAEKLEGIQTEHTLYPIDGCFIALGSASGFTLAMHMGIALNGNRIQTNEKLETNVPGLYAGGDVIGGLLQVSKAVGDGAIAATSMASYLKRK